MGVVYTRIITECRKTGRDVYCVERRITLTADRSHPLNIYLFTRLPLTRFPLLLLRFSRAATIANSNGTTEKHSIIEKRKRKEKGYVVRFLWNKRIFLCDYFSSETIMDMPVSSIGDA